MTKLIFLRVATIGLLGSSLCSCSSTLPWGSLYSGDGRYVREQGSSSVLLGALPLDRPNTQVFQIKRLGPGYMWRAEIQGPPGVPGATVQISLRDSQRRVVFERTERLDRWRGEPGGFKWLVGEGREVLVQGGVSYERLGVGLDQGWGTSFVPRASVSYELAVTLLEPSPWTPQGAAPIRLKTSYPRYFWWARSW